jgi:hypothetical protein
LCFHPFLPLIPAGGYWTEEKKKMMLPGQTLPSRTLPLESAEKMMQRRWFALVLAEQHGQPVEVLERLYRSYERAVEQFVRLAQEEAQRRVS